MNFDLVSLSFDSLPFQVLFLLAFLIYMVKFAVPHLCGASDTEKICISSSIERFDIDFSLRFSSLLMVKIFFFFVVENRKSFPTLVMAVEIFISKCVTL